jgi:hypothetical protein
MTGEPGVQAYLKKPHKKINGSETTLLRLFGKIIENPDQTL